MYKINKDQGKNSISQHQESAFIYEKISYICSCYLNPRKLINNQIEKAV